MCVCVIVVVVFVSFGLVGFVGFVVFVGFFLPFSLCQHCLIGACCLFAIVFYWVYTGWVLYSVAARASRSKSEWQSPPFCTVLRHGPQGALLRCCLPRFELTIKKCVKVGTPAF